MTMRFVHLDKGFSENLDKKIAPPPPAALQDPEIMVRILSVFFKSDLKSTIILCCLVACL